jgi:hypothetical protein
MKGPRLKLLGRPVVDLRRPAGEVIALDESRWYGAPSILRQRDIDWDLPSWSEVPRTPPRRIFNLMLYATDLGLSVPDREIDWVGLGDPDNRGRFVFEAIDGDMSKVTMMLDYEPESIVEEIGDALGLVNGRLAGQIGGNTTDIALCLG